MEVPAEADFIALVSRCTVQATCSHAQTAGAGTEKTVIALEDQRLESEKTNNPDLAAPVFGDRYIGIRRQIL